MYNPVELARIIEPLVAPRTNNVQHRKYYRFRADRWYGGIATGDVVGCNLRCGFCWSWRYSWKTSRGELLDPDNVATRLIKIARSRRISQVRLSGGEPTIGFDHLLRVIENLTSRGIHFVLETNGILIGASDKYAREIASFHRAGIEVRISIKGTSPNEFYTLTRASPEYWRIQLEALDKLVGYGLEPGEEVYPAIMLSFSSEKGLTRIKRLLALIDYKLVEAIDPEYVIMYPHVKELMKKRGLSPRTSFKPHQVPRDMI